MRSGHVAQVLDQRLVDVGGGPGPLAVGAEQHHLMVAEHVAHAQPAGRVDHLVAEPVLVDAVARHQDLVHPTLEVCQSVVKGFDVAVDIRHHTEQHKQSFRVSPWSPDPTAGRLIAAPGVAAGVTGAVRVGDSGGPGSRLARR